MLDLPLQSVWKVDVCVIEFVRPLSLIQTIYNKKISIQ